MTSSIDAPPLVTVVTPCLDPGERLARCIASVRGQTYSRVEHVVVDGGSTDGTIHRLDRSSVRWISEPDSGQANAINKGFKLAQGSILGWLNADDVLLPDAIEAVVAAFNDDRAVAWAMGDVVVTDGKIGRRERPAVTRGPRAWTTRNLAAQPGSFHSRAALEQVGYLDESFHFMMDLDLWLRLIDEGLRWIHVPRVQAIFEVHEASKSGAISHAAFLEEEAWARLKSGREEQAAFALGRAAAWRSEERNARIPRDAWEQVEEITGRRQQLGGVSEAAVAAGIAVETAIIRLKRRDVGALIMLSRPAILSHPLTRDRLGDVFGRGLRQLLRRDRVALPALEIP